MNRTYLIVGAVSLVSLAAGGAGGYLLAEKRMREKYEAVAKRDIAEMKEFYKKFYKAEEYETAESAAAVLVPDRSDFQPPAVDTSPLLGDAVEAVQAYAGLDPAPVVTQEQVRNLFVENTPLDREWDYEAEMARRTPDAPYIISHQEFLENDGDFEQQTVTYFEGDDVLADETQAPVQNPLKLIGDEALSSFGYGSDDNRIVYVRNPKLEVDLEIIKSPGKFAKEVLGFDFDDDEEDRRKRPQRLQRGDDE